MAACVLQFNALVRKFQSSICLNSIGFVRHASEIGSSAVGPHDHGRPSQIGIRKQHAKFVRAGTLLLSKHKLLKFAPGLNVGIGESGKLYAKTPGRFIVTCEKTNFDPAIPIVRKVYPNCLPIYKKYANVIPDPPHRRFKYIESF